MVPIRRSERLDPEVWETIRRFGGAGGPGPEV